MTDDGSHAALAIHYKEFHSPVASSPGDGGVGMERPIRAIALRSDARGGDPAADQVVEDGASAVLAELEVPVLRAVRTAVPLDVKELYVAVPFHDASDPIKDICRRRTQEGISALVLVP